MFSTKDRRPFICDEWRGELDRYIGGLVRENGGELLEIGGMRDHVHLALRLRPDVSLSDLMGFVKANASPGFTKRDFVATSVGKTDTAHSPSANGDSGADRLHPRPTGTSPHSNASRGVYRTARAARHRLRSEIPLVVLKPCRPPGPCTSQATPSPAVPFGTAIRRHPPRCGLICGPSGQSEKKPVTRRPSKARD